MLIRPVQLDDHAAVLNLAKHAGFGMTSLPPDEDVLRAKITRAVVSMHGQAPEGEELFLFVLEDNGQIGGICGIVAHVGANEPFYSYRLSTIAQHSEACGIKNTLKTLHISNDFTGATEVIALYLLPEFRRDGMGKFLSLVRFLFIAQYPDMFDTRVIAEIRGTHDHKGSAPFYDAIAKPFFHMSFTQADYLNATKGNRFISDLMPHYPIYVELLPESAQGVIGRANDASAPAQAMLESQGFKWQGYVDIFDGGPTLQAERSSIKAITASKQLPICATQDPLTLPQTPRYIVASTKPIEDQRYPMRATIARLTATQEGVILSEQAAKRLDIQVGDAVRLLPLHEVGAL